MNEACFTEWNQSMKLDHRQHQKPSWETACASWPGHACYTSYLEAASITSQVVGPPQFLVPYRIYLEYKLPAAAISSLGLASKNHTEGLLWLIYNSQLCSIQWGISLQRVCPTYSCESEWLCPFISLGSLDRPSALALVVHRAFGVRPRDRDILHQSEYQPNFKEKKGSRVMRESPEYLPDTFIWKQLCFKATSHSPVDMYHVCAHRRVFLCPFVLWPLFELNHYARLWAEKILGQRHFPCSSYYS